MTIDEVRSLLAYGRWANEQAFAAADALTPDELGASAPSSFPSVRETLGHIVSAEWVWLRRWRGESPSDRLTASSLARAFGCFQEAAEMDPGYAAPHSGLADGHILAGLVGLVPPRQAWDLAEVEARDDTVAEAHVSLAYLRLFRDWDFAGSPRTAPPDRGIGRVRSTSWVRRGSPHRCTATPPMKQKRQPFPSQRSWSSPAASRIPGRWITAVGTGGTGPAAPPGPTSRSAPSRARPPRGTG